MNKGRGKELVSVKEIRPTGITLPNLLGIQFEFQFFLPRVEKMRSPLILLLNENTSNNNSLR